MSNRLQPRYTKGQRIGGRYLVHQALMGGMGEVYLCLDEKNSLPLALKTFQTSDSRLKDIFYDEVANWITIERHPNIVHCHAMEVLDNHPFAIMDWIASEEGRGTDLRAWLQKGKLNIEQALLFTVDIVRGLIHANEKVPGIVHRDLKPDNVLVNQAKQAKISDFGLALVLQKVELSTESNKDDIYRNLRVGNIVGTPHYMAPEQWRGEVDIDFRTDIYAVGCILYELLTGKTLYDGRTINELRTQHQEAPLPTLNNDFPPTVRHILNSCLEKQPIYRFERLGLLFDELQQFYETLSGKRLPEVSSEEFTATDYNNRGVTFSNLGQHEQAIQDYEQAIHLDPTLAITYSNRSTHYGDLGQHERAIADCDEAIRLDPTLAIAYSNRGRSYGEIGQHERAIADCDEAIRLDSTLAIAYSNRGRSYGDLGQHQQAIQDLNTAIHLDSTLALAYSNRGRSYGDLGQHQQAIADCDEAIRLDPTLALAYSNRGRSYGDLGQHQQAIADCDEAIHLDPIFALAFLNRGRSYSALEQYEYAVADFDEAIRLDPNFSLAFHGRGSSYSNSGQYEDAIADFDEAIRLNPNFAVAFSSRGYSYSELGQHQQAIADCDEAIRLNPNLAMAYSNRGRSYGDLGQHQQAIADCDEAIRLDPNLAIAYSNRGRSYGDLGQHQQAIADCDEAVRLNPNLALAYSNRGRSYGDLGQHQQAIADCDEAVRLNPKLALAFLNRGRSYSILEQDEQAIQDFDTAIRLDNLPLAYFNKGAVIANAGQLHEALPLFEKADALGYQQAAGIIQQIRQALSSQPMQLQADPNDPQAAFDTFQQVTALDEMQQIVERFPVLRQMIPAIKQVIEQQVPPEYKSVFKQKLAWLRHIVEEG